jgi:hypothetical protein
MSVGNDISPMNVFRVSSKNSDKRIYQVMLETNIKKQTSISGMIMALRIDGDLISWPLNVTLLSSETLNGSNNRLGSKTYHATGT